MNFDPLFYPYPSRRRVVFSKGAMVATSQPLAAQAGLEIMKKGGNAIDAAISAATCLTVVEPTSNGIGGDAFALVWSGGKLRGLNSSGPRPKGYRSRHLPEQATRNCLCTESVPSPCRGRPRAGSNCPAIRKSTPDREHALRY